MDSEIWESRKCRLGRIFIKPYCIYLALLLTAVVAGTLVLADRVQASPCGNCYTKSWQNGSFAGVKATWDIQDLYAQDWAADYGGFVIQDIWAVTNLSGEGEWAEVWYTHGFKRTNYLGFGWSEQWYNTNLGRYVYEEYRINNPSAGPIGTPYEFQINYVGDSYNGRRIYAVYINGQCVRTIEDVPCEHWNLNWIQRHQVGGEATDSSNILGPTHLREIRNRPVGSQNWNLWSPSVAPQKDFGSYVYEYIGEYGNYSRVLYLMQNKYLDPFDGPDGTDPNWPKTAGYWSESGGDIFIHQVPTYWSHLHMDYGNPSGYLLMRRDKNDGYTGSPIVVEFGFADDLATPAGRFFGVWNSGDSTQMGLGVHTGQWPNTYFYRVSNSTTLINTGIPRSFDWHTFRFYVTSSGCSYGELDGTSLASLGTNCSITPGTLNKWGVASAWGLTDPEWSDGIWDNAVYFHR